jgi:hypothetical protein
MKRIVLAGFLIVAVAVTAYAVTARGHTPAPAPAAPAARPRAGGHAPAGTRIRVQVLNATRVQGLARRAMFYLRDRGFDVVDLGNAGEMRDSTLVLDRSGHPEWAKLVATAFEDASVAARPDSSRYLDVTVLIGASWRPPPQPLYP